MARRKSIQNGTTLTIYTERQQLEGLKTLARARQVSMAEVLRDALRRYLSLAAVQREIGQVRAAEALQGRVAERRKVARLKSKLQRGVR